MIKLQLHSIVEDIDAIDPLTSVLTPIRIEPLKEHGRPQPKSSEFVEHASLCSCGRRKRAEARTCARCAHTVYMEDRTA